MKRTLALAFVLLMAMPVVADELQDVLDKHYEAMGGLEKIKSIQSAKLTGKMSMQGMELPLTVLSKRPRMARIEFSVQGMTGIQATDGETAWSVMPFMGKPDAEAMPEDEAADLNEQADMEGPLVDWKEKGYQLALMGKEDVEGTSCYKIKVVRKDGKESYAYLDDEYYLQIRNESKRQMQGTEVETVTNFGDFKEVDGLMMAHVMDSGIKGTDMMQTLTLETVEFGVELDDSVFAMPVAAEAPADEK